MKQLDYDQQGDVVILKIAKIPAKVKKLDHLILAEGESTGHLHQITQGLACLYSSGNDMFLKVLSETAKLKHDEHHALILDKGNYQIGQVDEYDHFEEEARRVRD